MFKHLKEANETYIQHFIKAAGFGIKSIAIGIILLIHAIIPCLFERTGSAMLQRILDKIKLR
jgi:hypothetical protein